MPFELTIITPSREAFRGPVESVVLPGAQGEFGVLPGHERLLSPLRIGEVEIRTADDVVYAAIADGFADVSGEAVAVLVESCECADEVDKARAELARERAEEGLAALGEDAAQQRVREYEAALERARTRIAVAERAQQ